MGKYKCIYTNLDVRIACKRMSFVLIHVVPLETYENGNIKKREFKELYRPSLNKKKQEFATHLIIKIKFCKD